MFEMDDVKAKLPAELHKPTPPIPRMHPDELPEKYVSLLVVDFFVTRTSQCIFLSLDSCDG